MVETLEKALLTRRVSSAHWVRAQTFKHFNQRVEFRLAEKSYLQLHLSRKELHGAESFDRDQPILVNGIFMTFHKIRHYVPTQGPEFGFLMTLRDVVFKQGEKMFFATDHRRHNKHRKLSFEIGADIDIDASSIRKMPILKIWARD